MPVPLGFTSSRSVPLPVTPLTVTSTAMPLAAETALIVPLAVPVRVSTKSETSIPLIAEVNRTPSGRWRRG